MVMIAPSILSADFLNLGKEIKAIEDSGADMIHIDVMDGHFVPNMTIGPDIVRRIRGITGMVLDVHLMIEDPDKYTGNFITAGADIITVHAEAARHMHRTVQSIRAAGKKAGVSINPATPLNWLDDILDDADLVLIMSVNPGFGGQKFIPGAKRKIESLKKMISERGLRARIEVDGGVKLDNAGQIARSGADILVMGSGYFESGDYGETVRRFRHEVQS